MNRSKLAALMVLAASTANAADPQISRSNAKNACESSEQWVLSPAIPKESAEEFRNFISGATSTARGFAEALALRRSGLSAESMVFAEYWMARAIHKAGLPHVAFSGFAMIASAETQTNYAGVQTAALQCLSNIRDKYNSLALPQKAIANLSNIAKLATTSDERRAVHHFAFNAFIETQDASILPLLSGAGARESAANGLQAARLGKHKDTVQHFERFFDPKLADQRGVRELAKFRDHFHLLISRALFSIERFDDSIDHLRAISKSSNELSSALSELSWSSLMGERYGEAVGASVSLQAGGLKHTFAPEAPMVVAMALNELCQYPQSLKAITTFKKNYEASYRWLEKWNASRAQNKSSSYATVVAFLQKKEPEVPVRVGSEWLRSPVFISGQTEINLLADERDQIRTLAQSAAAEQRRFGREIRETADSLLVRIKKERGMQKTYSVGLDSLSQPLQFAIRDFRKKVVHYRRFRMAAEPWRNIMENFQGRIPGMKSSIIGRINADLIERNSRMLATLQEIAENNQLIEVEIYNGASQDIIWQNAHPEYKEKMAEMGNEQRRGIASKVLDWGSSSADADGETEIWEDEIGSFNANVFDNCSNKDRYLAIGGK